MSVPVVALFLFSVVRILQRIERRFDDEPLPLAIQRRRAAAVRQISLSYGFTLSAYFKPKPIRVVYRNR